MACFSGPEIVNEGLVLHLDAANPRSYPGSGTIWKDLSVNGNNGALINGPAFNMTNAGYFVFDGVNDYVSIPHSISLTPSSEISICAWAYQINWNITTSSKIISKTENGGYAIALNNSITGVGFLGAFVYVNGAYRSVKIQTSNLTPGWHHISISFNGRYLYLFVDALLVNTYDYGSFNDISYAYNNHLVIGAEPGATTNIGGDFFPGNISVIQLYSRALSITEIKQNFEATRDRYGI